MITRAAVAIIKKEAREELWPETITLFLNKKKIRAKVKWLPSPSWLSSEGELVWFQLNRPADVYWKEKVKILSSSEGSVLALGEIIDPAPDLKNKKYFESSRLKLLASEAQDMLLALLRLKGIRGLREKEITEFCGFTSESILSLAQELELKGLIKILGFNPLFLISQESLIFLVDQLLAFLKRYHQKHPEALGIQIEKLRKRFRLPRLILNLALAKMKKDDLIIFREKEVVSLPFDEIPLDPEELKILAELERMCYQGEFRRVSLEELKNRFRLSRRSIEKLLAHLVARKKIFESADGFYIHSHWLEEIIQRLRHSGKKEMTVGEFKAMTGLSRKYAIPLLELLDRMGITRRKGSIREIL